MNLKNAQRSILNFMPRLIKLRRDLHAAPELSDNEQKTAGAISEFFEQLNPDQGIAPLGGNGIAFLFDSRRPAPP